MVQKDIQVLYLLAVFSQETCPPQTATCAAQRPLKKLFWEAGGRCATYLETVGGIKRYKIRIERCLALSGIFWTHHRPYYFVGLYGINSWGDIELEIDERP